MKVRHPPLFLLLALISTTLAAPKLTCLPMGTWTKGPLVDSRNCAQAMIQSLPFQSDTGFFHRWAKDDVYQLPRTASLLDCTVTVDIKPDTEFASSWTAIWGLASSLNLACAQYYNSNGGAFTGGTVTVGYLSISMGKGPRYLSLGNGTSVGNGTGVASE